MKSLKEFVFEKEFFVVAHRGLLGTAPENTLSAFKEAIDAGADMIETDVQLTLDGNVIVFHDKAVSRTTNGIGFTQEMPLHDIKKLEAGAWFHKNFEGETIPLLTEVLELIQDKVYINIEVKNILADDLDDKIKTILKIIHDYEYQDKALFSSFFYKTLYKLKKFDKKINTAAIRIPRDTRLPSTIASEIACEAFVCSLSEATMEISKDIKDNNMFLGIYSIDNAEMLKEALSYNIKAIVTNYPARIISEINKL